MVYYSPSVTDEEKTMDKIKVANCCGTACYLLGAANLISIEDEWPDGQALRNQGA